jgi:hypothetical protein
MFGYGFSLNTMFTLCPFETKRGSIFCFWTENVFPNRSSVLFQNDQRESLLVFYVGNILVDKNTLCNGCILNRFIDFIQSLQVIWAVFVSSNVTGHKFLEDVHEDSILFLSQINWLLCNHPDGPLKASGLPAVSRSFNVEDVGTSEQHRPVLGQATPSSIRSWISVDTIWEVSTRRPDATYRSRIFRVSFTDAKISDSEDCPDARPSRPDVVLLWEELCYSGKVVAKDRPNKGKLPFGRSTARVQICLELGFLKPINRWL